MRCLAVEQIGICAHESSSLFGDAILDFTPWGVLLEPTVRESASCLPRRYLIHWNLIQSF